MPTPSVKRPATISIDFTGVEVSKGLRSDHIPEGDYLVKVIDCVERRKKDDKTVKMLLWQFEVVEPKKYAGKKLLNNTVLVKESLWALRSMLVNMLGEARVPASSLDIPIAAIVKKQKQLGVTVEDDDYNPNKLKSKISDTFPPADWENKNNQDIDDEDAEEEEEDDEEDTKKKATSSDDDEDMDEIDDVDI